MSTKTSYAYEERGPLRIHIYHEMMDSCAHLEIENEHQWVNVILPHDLAAQLAALIEGLPTDATPDQQGEQTR